MHVTKFYATVPSEQNQSVVVIYNSLPDEPEFCLYVKWNRLNVALQQTISTLASSLNTSPITELAGELANIRHGEYNFLQFLHKAGLLEKIRASHVILEPIPGMKITQAALNEQLRNLKNESATITTQSTGTNQAANAFSNITQTLAPSVVSAPSVVETPVANLSEIEQKVSDLSAQVENLTSTLTATVDRLTALLQQKSEPTADSQ